MNQPVQATWGDVQNGDLVTPNGTDWYRVINRTGSTFAMRGPVTPDNLEAGTDSTVQLDTNGAVTMISTQLAPAVPAAPSMEQAVQNVQTGIPGAAPESAPERVASKCCDECGRHALAIGNLTARVARLETGLKVLTAGLVAVTNELQ